MKVYSIYRITCNVNRKNYIGYTGQEINGYLKEHFASAERGVAKLLYDAIRKHGSDNFTTEVLCQTTIKSYAVELECHFISQFDSFCHSGKGYNLTFGGDGGDTSSSPKYQAGIARRNLKWKTHPPEHISGGWKHDAAAKKKMSDAHRGWIPKNYNDFILFSKGKKYIHNSDTNDEFQVLVERIPEYLKAGYQVGRLKVACPYCGLMSGPSNLLKHQMTKCPMKESIASSSK